MNLNKITISGIFGVKDVATCSLIENAFNNATTPIFKAIKLIFDPAFEEISSDFITNQRNPFVSIYCRNVSNNAVVALTRNLIHPEVVVVNQKEVPVGKFYNMLQTNSVIHPDLNFVDKEKIDELMQLSPATALKLLLNNFHSLANKIPLNEFISELMEMSFENNQEFTVNRYESHSVLVDKAKSYKETREQLQSTLNVVLNPDKIQITKKLGELQLELAAKEKDLFDLNTKITKNAALFRKMLAYKWLQKEIYMEAKKFKLPIPIWIDTIDVNILEFLEQNLKCLFDVKKLVVEEFGKYTNDYIASIKSSNTTNKLNHRYYSLLKHIKMLKEQNKTEDLKTARRELDEKISKQEENKKDTEFCQDEYKRQLKSFVDLVEKEAHKFRTLAENIQTFFDLLKTNCKKMEEFVLQIDGLKIEMLKIDHQIITCEEKLKGLISKCLIDEKYIRGLQTALEYIFSPKTDQRLKDDYVGVIYQHLQESPRDEKRLWGVIKYKVLTVLFRNSNAMNNFATALKDSKFPIKLMGFDSFKPKAVTIPQNIESSVLSGEVLLKKQVSDEIKTPVSKFLSNSFATNSECAVAKLKELKCNFVDEINEIAYSDRTLSDSMSSYFKDDTSMIALLKEIESCIMEICNLKSKKEDHQIKLQEKEEFVRKLEEEVKTKYRDMMIMRARTQLNAPRIFTNILELFKTSVDIAISENDDDWIPYLIKLRNEWDVAVNMSMESITTEFKRLTEVYLEEYKESEIKKLQFKLKENEIKLELDSLDKSFKMLKKLLSSHFQDTSMVRELDQKFRELELKRCQTLTRNFEWIMNDPCLIECDPEKMRVAINNLLSEINILKKEEKTLLELTSVEGSEQPPADLEGNYNLRENLNDIRDLNKKLKSLNSPEITQVEKLLKLTDRAVGNLNNNVLNDDDESMEIVPKAETFTLDEIKQFLTIYEKRCSLILSDFMESGKLLFCIEENFDEMADLGSDTFGDINAFNLLNFKSMKMQWTPKPAAGSIDCVQVKKIEGIVLMMMLIERLHLKVVIIDDNIYQGMGNALSQQFCNFLDVVSRVIQIISIRDN